METRKLPENDEKTFITHSSKKYSEHIEVIGKSIELLRKKIGEDETICLSAKEIADAIYMKHRLQYARRSGGRKSRIEEIIAWVDDYRFDFPEASIKELRKDALEILSAEYAKSTIYEAFRRISKKNN